MKSHVPGAVALDVRAVLFDEVGDVVSAPEIAMAMSGLGVGDGHTIVIVGRAVSREIIRHRPASFTAKVSS